MNNTASMERITGGDMVRIRCVNADGHTRNLTRRVLYVKEGEIVTSGSVGSCLFAQESGMEIWNDDGVVREIVAINGVDL